MGNSSQFGRDYREPLSSPSIRAKRRSRSRIAMVASATVTALGYGLLTFLGTDSPHSVNALEERDLPLPPVQTRETVSHAAGPSHRVDARAQHAARVTPIVAYPALSDAAPSDSAEAAPAEVTAQQENWLNIRVRSGDSLAAIFSRNGLGALDVHKVVSSSKLAKGLARIRPGQTLKLQINDGELMGVIHEWDRVSGLRIERDGEGFKSKPYERALDSRVNFANAEIRDSLYQTARRSGLADRVILQLAEIFGYDVDFALDIREGDRFSVLYEEQFLDGEKYRDGEILVAEFTNQGQTYRAIRFVDDEGNASYYTPDGLSLRKAFLRTPVEFARISSRFTLRRWHPILKKWRAHRGVDYAASTGTPIRSTGSGRITHLGTKGGYGKVVMIQHGDKYTTVYGHMSRFARGLRSGSRVRQGQVIGYVGQTGYATGPHLHYEFRVNGAHKNPLTIKLPKADPIPAKYKNAFDRHAKRLTAQLENHRRVVIAQAE